MPSSHIYSFGSDKPVRFYNIFVLRTQNDLKKGKFFSFSFSYDFGPVVVSSIPIHTYIEKKTAECFDFQG